MNKTIIGILAIVLVGGGAFILTQQTSAPTATNTQSETKTDPATSSGDVATQTQDNTFAIDPDYPPLAIYSDEASAQAATDGKSVLMFHATWCPTCRAALKDFNENLSQIPEDVTIFRVDFDTQKDLKKKHNIVTQDTFVQVGPDGNEIAKWNSGGKGIETLLENII